MVIGTPGHMVQSPTFTIPWGIMGYMQYRLASGTVPTAAYNRAQIEGSALCGGTTTVSEPLVVYVDTGTTSRVVGVLRSSGELSSLISRLGKPSIKIVGRGEIADLLGTTPQTVDSWRQRYSSFPEPLGTIGNGARVWDWADIREWNARERPYGRHIPKPVEATNL